MSMNYLFSLLVNTTTLTSSTVAPTIDSSGFSYSNITVTVRLGNLKYNADYGRKTSTSYKELSKNITIALTEVYKNISGFEGVEILYLTCEQEVAAKHIVIINSKEMVNTTIIITKLNMANNTGFLKGKITAANETCGSGQSDNKHSSGNWIYMIVFVIITALLLLAMVSTVVIQYTNLLLGMVSFFLPLRKTFYQTTNRIENI